MALKPLDPIGDDAFKDGFLSKKRAQEIVDRLNTPWKVKLDGAPEAKVEMATENNTINMTPMLGGKVRVWTVINGGLFEVDFVGKVLT